MSKKLEKGTEEGKLCFVSVGGKTYFGMYDRDSRVITNAMGQSTFSKSMMVDYIKKSNLGELVSVEIGSADSVAVTSLTQMEYLTVQSLMEQFKLAQSMAMPMLENQSFDRLLGN